MDSLDFEVVPFATRLTGANQLVGMIQTGARMPNLGLPRDFPAVVSCSCPALVIGELAFPIQLYHIKYHII